MNTPFQTPLAREIFRCESAVMFKGRKKRQAFISTNFFQFCDIVVAEVDERKVLQVLNVGLLEKGANGLASEPDNAETKVELDKLQVDE